MKKRTIFGIGLYGATTLILAIVAKSPTGIAIGTHILGLTIIIFLWERS